MNRTLRLSLLPLAILAVSACKKSVPDVDVSALPPRVVLLNEAHDPAELRTVVISELQSHSWSTEGENGPQILGRLNHKGQMIRVAIDYEPQRVVLRVLEAQANEKSLDGYVGKLERGIRDTLNKAPVVVAAPVVAVAAPPANLPAPTLVVFEREQAPNAVVPALQRALAQHSWVLESSDDNGLVARLNHRKGMVRVRVQADTRQASITYLDSQDLSFDGGGRNDEYEKWMRNLSDAIRSNTR